MPPALKRFQRFSDRMQRCFHEGSESALSARGITDFVREAVERELKRREGKRKKR